MFITFSHSQNLSNYNIIRDGGSTFKNASSINTRICHVVVLKLADRAQVLDHKMGCLSNHFFSLSATIFTAVTLETKLICKSTANDTNTWSTLLRLT